MNSVQQFEVSAIQRPIQSVYSKKNGSGILTFSIGATEQWLLPHSCHLQMKIRVLQGDGSRPNNNAQAGGTVKNVTLDSRTGGIGVIDSVMVNTKRGRTLEHGRNYTRMSGTILPNTSSWEDYTTYMSNVYGSVANSFAQDRMTNRDILVSQPLLLGTFSGQPIPLGMKNGVGGLDIMIYLQNNPSAIFGANASESGGAYYEILECSLTGKYMNPASGMLPDIKGWTYSNVHSYYNTISQGDETLVLNPGLGNVLSQFSSFIPTPHISNYSENEYSTPPLQNLNAGGTAYTVRAPVRQLDFLKNGMKFPLQFSENFNNIISQNSTGSYDDSGYEALRQRTYLDAIKPFSGLTHTLASPMSEAIGSANLDNSNNYVNYGNNCYGIGTRYDNLNVGSGANFQMNPFSQRIRSLLDGRGNVSIYTFMIHKNMLVLNNQVGAMVEN
jgi:hypothetical protein